MFSNRLASHLERGVVGFPTTLASSVGLIMASPVILTVTSGFGMGGDTFALAVLLAFIMMQAQVTTFAEAATLIPTTGSVYDYISCGMGRFFAITGALCAYLIVHIFAGTAETILAGIMALVNWRKMVQAAVTRKSSSSGNVIRPELAISVADGVRMYTINAAYQEGKEAVRESIEVGKVADFQVLDRDIFAVAHEEIGASRVVMTMVGGNVVFQD